MFQKYHYQVSSTKYVFIKRPNNTVEREINPRCKLTEFELFFIPKANIEGLYSKDRNDTFDSNYTELTLLEYAAHRRLKMGHPARGTSHGVQ